MASATGLLNSIGLSLPFLHRAEAEPRKVTAPARPAPWAGSGNPSARNSHRRFPATKILAVSSPISLTLQHRSPSPQSLTLCAHQQPATSWIMRLPGSSPVHAPSVPGRLVGSRHGSQAFRGRKACEAQRSTSSSQRDPSGCARRATGTLGRSSGLHSAIGCQSCRPDTVPFLSCPEAQKLRFQGADHSATLRGPSRLGGKS
jgi:hypothetical protein